MKIVKEQIESSKGKLAATVQYPDVETEKLAILCPGFLDSKDYAGLTELANRLAENGYTAVRFDPTGVWESDGNIEDYTVTQYLEDIKNVLEHMLAKNDFTHVLLVGHSRGGTAALLYAARDLQVSAVLGIMSPYKLASWEKWNEDGLRFSSRDMPGSDEKVEFTIPVSYLEDLEKYDVLEEVKKLKVPVMLLAGEMDKGVLPGDVKKIYDNVNEPKHFEVIPSVGHDYRVHESQVKLVNECVMRGLEKMT